MGEFGLQMLMIADRYARYEEANDRFKLALITHNPRITPDLYPAWAKAEAPVDDKQLDQALRGDQAVRYDLDPLDPGEAERVLAQMVGTNQTVKVT